MTLKKLANKLTYEKRTEYLAVYSIVINVLLAIGKCVLAYVYRDSGGGFFVISAIVNIFLMIAKLECYRGIKETKDLGFRTFVIFMALVVTAVVYIMYMSRLFFYENMHIEYPIQIGMIIATVAFIELTLSIRGLFTVKGRGHFYRDIKIINLCGAILAIVLTQVSLLSFTSESAKVNTYDAISGIIAGIIILILAVFILISLKVSIFDRSKRRYRYTVDAKKLPDEYVLLKGYLYGRCIAVFDYSEDDVVLATIKRENVKFKGIKWYYILLIIVFFVIIAIPYLIGATVNYFIVGHTPADLDNYMWEHGYELIKEEK